MTYFSPSFFALIKVEAMVRIARLAAQKLIHPPVPPTMIRHTTTKAKSVTIVITKTRRRNRFVLSLAGVFFENRFTFKWDACIDLRRNL